LHITYLFMLHEAALFRHNAYSRSPCIFDPGRAIRLANGKRHVNVVAVAITPYAVASASVTSDAELAVLDPS
jgi:hypothetical protein